MKPAQRIAALLILLTHTVFAAALSDDFDKVRAVGPEGQGNAAASTAWKNLAAVETIASREAAGDPDGV